MDMGLELNLEEPYIDSFLFSLLHKSKHNLCNCYLIYYNQLKNKEIICGLGHLQRLLSVAIA